MPQNTKLCFDYRLGQVCLGRTSCKFKRVRYHRDLDSARKEPRMGTATQYTVWSPVSPPVKAVLTPKQIYDFNPSAYYKTINAQVGQLLMNNFPWGQIDRSRSAPYNLGQTRVLTESSTVSGKYEAVYRYVQLPPNKYEFRDAPLKGKAAFMKWYDAFASGQDEPGKRWPLIFSHLTQNWQNYTDSGSKADDILKKMQLLIQQAFSGIIVLNAAQ